MPTVCADPQEFLLDGLGRLALLIKAAGGITHDVDGLQISGPRAGEWPFAGNIAADNGARLNAAGQLWVPPDMEVVGFTGTSSRWSVLIDNYVVNTINTVSAIPTVTVTNPSPSRTMLVLCTLSSREVEYNGPALAMYETIVQLAVNGGAYANAASIVQNFIGRATTNYLQRDGFNPHVQVVTVGPGASVTFDARTTLTRLTIGDTQMIASCEGMRLVGVGITVNS